MSEQDTLRESLEDFSARVMAVDPSDVAQVAQLRLNLKIMLRSLETDSPSSDLLKLGLTALQAIEQRKRPDTSSLLDAVAGATAAIVKDLDSENDGSEISAATALLKTILASQDACPDPLPAEHAYGQESSAPQAPASPFISLLESDPELCRDFIAESCDRIAAAEAALLALEANPDDKEQVNTILRAFHTIKGASGFLGLDQIQELAHLAENLLIRVRDGHIRMRDEHADTALQSCDALRIMVKSLDPAAKATGCLDTGKLAALVERLSIAEAGKTQMTPNAGGLPDASTPAADEGTAPVDKITGEGTQTSDRHYKETAQRPTEGVRVNAERLDELVNMVGELVIAHSIISQAPLVAGRADHQLTQSVSHAGKILRSLQDLTLGLRMVPLRPTFGKMARLVRDLARRSGKSVQLVAGGEDTEIDRNMVEVLSDPLVHMIRNAVDHGIEPEQERTRRGKQPTGMIHLRAYHSAGNVVIELQDDGRGLDRQGILAKAAKCGWVKEERELTDTEVYSLIFLPGLSTAEQVTDVSGRGVGMDVVKRNIDFLRGKIEVQSTEGQGSTFTLRLPLTLAIADAMLLTVGKERFLLPTISIEHSFRPNAGMVSTVTGRGEMVMIRGQLLPVFRMYKLFAIEGAVTDPNKALLIVIEGNGKRCAMMVDHLDGQQQVVIKPLGKMFANIPGVSGGAILGDGRVGLILDAAGLVQLSHGQTKAA